MLPQGAAESSSAQGPRAGCPRLDLVPALTVGLAKGEWRILGLWFWAVSWGKGGPWEQGPMAGVVMGAPRAPVPLSPTLGSGWVGESRGQGGPRAEVGGSLNGLRGLSDVAGAWRHVRLPLHLRAVGVGGGSKAARQGMWHL